MVGYRGMGDTKEAWKSAEGHKGHGGGTEEGTVGD